MSAYFDIESNNLFISAYELCSYMLRGGDMDSYLVNGNKVGHTVVSHSFNAPRPNLSGSYYFSTMYEGLTITVYTFPEEVKDDGMGGYVVQKVQSVQYHVSEIENGELDIALASVICSAYIVMMRLGGENVEGCVAFFGENDGQKVYRRNLKRADSESYFNELITKFGPFAKIIASRYTKCLPQLKNLKFPFEGGARSSQKEFITDAYRAICTHKRLIVQAPTGTGKTMAALYPSLKAIGNGYADKIFYFTGKATTAYAALSAVDIMRDSLPQLRSIHITSKEKCCTNHRVRDSRKCKGVKCGNARGYFDKVNDALLELLRDYRTYTKDIIDKIALKYSVCSYELSLELSEWCELIVCDYNYLFDLSVYLRRYFTSPDANYVFLIDEAHNLPDRAREMYSCTLKRTDFIKLEQKYPKNAKYTRACGDVLSKFDELHALAMMDMIEQEEDVFGFYVTSELPEQFGTELAVFAKHCDRILSNDIIDEELSDVYFEIKHMLKICEIFDKRFKLYLEAHNEELTMRLLCLDASYMLDKAMRKGISTILFSATLTPLEYFSDVLGCGKSATLNLKSPYDSENLCLLGINNVSTRYGDRQKNALTVANIIRATVAGKPGNYMVYFPSYSYLTDVKEVFEKKYPNIRVTTQLKSMTDNAKKDFLSSFNTDESNTLIGFCVMGGSFSEGIDLQGERLIGAIIVGVGLPTISSELNIIKEYFDNTRENGYAYAYTYPGMNKVLQASGRVIRSEKDRGVVVLVDDRFATDEYRALMPESWGHIKFLNNANDLLRQVTNFWRK
ncbi:MAG: ATP-dependent DNA helicase [Clostridia bacterium]|nr:ATP-dependent DNA helicase [Clostridia bacterium]